jgi:putative SOS response-associated peptidase YedK
MCILFDIDTGLAIKWSKELRAWIFEADWREGADHWPGYQAPVIRPDWSRKKKGSMEVPKELVPAQWGLQPKWAKTSRWGRSNAYNARSETLTERPTFRDAFKRRRCIVPATHYYEPLSGIRVDEHGRFVEHDGEGGNRRAKFSRPGGEVMAMAGLWEPHYPRDDDLGAEPLPTFTIVTTIPNEEVAPAQDRMPVILRLEDVDRWLDLDTPAEELRSLMIPCEPGYLIAEDGGSMRRKKKEDSDPTLF